MLGCAGVLFPSGYGVLEQLPRLQRLHCQQVGRLPACLSRLTGLDDLSIDIGEYTQAEDALEAALQPLTGLTSL